MSDNGHALKHTPAVQPLRRLLARTDDALAMLAARGDAKAFEAMYRRHHQALYRYCHLILGDHDDASDALQNAMARAWEALRHGGRRGRVRAWLFRLAREEAVGILRDRPQHCHLDEMRAPEARGLEDTVETRRRLSRLRTDLAALPERQRSALLLRELCGLPHHEIAHVLDVSPAVARQTIYEARLALHAAEEGRQMSCELVRRALSDGDRRKLRARTIRSHLRDCVSCSSFAKGVRQRTDDLTAMTPGLPAAASASWLARLLWQHVTSESPVTAGAIGTRIAEAATAVSSVACDTAATVAAGAVMAAAVAGVIAVQRSTEPSPAAWHAQAEPRRWHGPLPGTSPERAAASRQGRRVPTHRRPIAARGASRRRPQLYGPTAPAADSAPAAFDEPTPAGPDGSASRGTDEPAPGKDARVADPVGHRDKITAQPGAPTMPQATAPPVEAPEHRAPPMPPGPAPSNSFVADPSPAPNPTVRSAAPPLSQAPNTIVDHPASAVPAESDPREPILPPAEITPHTGNTPHASTDHGASPVAGSPTVAAAQVETAHDNRPDDVAPRAGAPDRPARRDPAPLTASQAASDAGADAESLRRPGPADPMVPRRQGGAPRGVSHLGSKEAAAPVGRAENSRPSTGQPVRPPGTERAATGGNSVVGSSRQRPMTETADPPPVHAAARDASPAQPSWQPDTADSASRSDLGSRDAQATPTSSVVRERSAAESPRSTSEPAAPDAEAGRAGPAPRSPVPTEAASPSTAPVKPPSGPSSLSDAQTKHSTGAAPEKTPPAGSATEATAHEQLGRGDARPSSLRRR